MARPVNDMEQSPAHGACYAGMGPFASCANDAGIRRTKGQWGPRYTGAGCAKKLARMW